MPDWNREDWIWTAAMRGAVLFALGAFVVAVSIWEGIG